MLIALALLRGERDHRVQQAIDQWDVDRTPLVVAIEAAESDITLCREFGFDITTPDFWRSCDGIAGPAYWQQFGSFFDGKGEPQQINAVSHGCSPARFRQVNVLLTD